MLNFEYYTPTKVVFGKGTEKRAGELARSFGASKVLVHYGGGSVIDSAKAIGYGLYHNCDPWLFYDRKAAAAGCVPIGAIPTIAAAGSEMSDSSVITNEDGWLKRGYSSDYSRCRFAIMNPELTCSLPPYQTSCGCTDILMHTMERYFSHEKHTELTDSISEALMRTVMHNAHVLMEDPQNYDARAEIMWAGSLSHNGLTGCGTAGDWASHQIEHELGGMFDVAHGAGLAAVWGSWARYVYQEEPEKFAHFAIHVMGVPADSGTAEETALAGIRAMEDFFRSINMPVSLSELGVHPTDDQIREMAQKCVFFGHRTVGGFKVLHAEDVEKIYRMAQ